MDQRLRPAPRGAGAGARRLCAFTLIELLVVVAVVGLLMALLAPGLARSRMAAKSVTCLARLRTLQLATRLYADEQRTMPLSMMDSSIPVYDLPVPAWRCPEDRQAVQRPMTDKAYSSYTYLAPLYMDPPAAGIVLGLLNPKAGLRKYENNPKLPLFWDHDENHEKDRNVVYWHGGAERRNWD